MTTSRPHAELAARYFNVSGQPACWFWGSTQVQHGALLTGNLYATAAEAQAWADFVLWCRGGGV